MSTQQVAQDVAQSSSMRQNPTPRTDAATYPADCLGKTLVVNRDCAAALETELTELRADILAAHGEMEQYAKLLCMSYSREALLIARAAMKEVSK